MNKKDQKLTPDLDKVEKEKLEEEKQDLENRLKRALADYQNLNKTVVLEKAEFAKYALEGFFLELLPVYENLKMSISTLNENDSNNPWVEGIKYVIKQFQDVFLKNGLEEIKAVGEKFDYNLMEAVEGKGEIVLKEIRPGYKLKGKVIIPAKVVLSELEENDNKE